METKIVSTLKLNQLSREGFHIKLCFPDMVASFFVQFKTTIEFFKLRSTKKTKFSIAQNWIH